MLVLSSRLHNIIVVHVCPINFFYVFIVPGPILRHLGEFGKIRLLLVENTRFLLEGGQYGYLKDGLKNDEIKKNPHSTVSKNIITHAL